MAHPSLYSVSGMDSSTYKLSTAIESLTVELEFEMPRAPDAMLAFRHGPVLTWVSAAGKLVQPETGAIAKRTLCFTRFEWNNLTNVGAGDEIKITWDRLSTTRA